MAETFALATLTAAIAAETITVVNARGQSVPLTIRDFNAIPASITQEMCPLLAPRPDNFLTNLGVTRDTFGADAAYKSAKYGLYYNLFFAPAAQGATMFSGYADMCACAAAVLLHFTTHTNLAGATDFLPQTIPHFGPLRDGKGALFHGCEIAFNVMQYLEA